MKLALVGYGKMGKAIEEIAIQRGHQIVLKISSSNIAELQKIKNYQPDVAIEFSNPEAALNNVKQCISEGVNTVCGTTGWYQHLNQVIDLINQENTGFLYASNFSVGVNIFFEVNKLLAKFMNNQKEYEILIEETHHTEKKDAPSGTAITLTEQILEHIHRKDGWILGNNNDPRKIDILAHRIENVPGTHIIKYESDIDSIEIRHTAHNRKGFALGAVLAAEYINGKQGVYTMKDVLGI